MDDSHDNPNGAEDRTHLGQASLRELFNTCALAGIFRGEHGPGQLPPGLLLWFGEDRLAMGMLIIGNRRDPALPKVAFMRGKPTTNGAPLPGEERPHPTSLERIREETGWEHRETRRRHPQNRNFSWDALEGLRELMRKRYGPESGFE